MKKYADTVGKKLGLDIGWALCTGILAAAVITLGACLFFDTFDVTYTGMSTSAKIFEGSFGWFYEMDDSYRAEYRQMIADARAWSDRLARFLTAWDMPLIAISAVSALGALFFFGRRLRSAGHHAGEEGITRKGFARLPLDLLALACLLVIGLGLSVLNGITGLYGICGYGWVDMAIVWGQELALLCFFLALPLYIFFICLAVHVKQKTVWSHTVCGGVFRYGWKGLRALGSRVKEAWEGLDARLRAALAFVAVTAAEGLMLLYFFMIRRPGWMLGCWMILRMLAFAVYAGMLARYVRLKKATQEIAAGDYTVRVPMDNTFPDLEKHAEAINSIGGGLDMAVSERMKSERFRTELITNVSHDIKTPLTSIINYVDLLERHGASDEVQKDYLDVLHRQSERLKKLIEDLIEASKASSGSLAVENEVIDARTIFWQVTGEYEDRLASAGLTPVVRADEAECRILADPKHLWRVYDNLMGNIVKYALSGTRVYLEMKRTEDRVVTVIRNISRAPLNITGEELMQRFVRGDSSRSTEGSGLGLSIADSLTQLMGGQMVIQVDGDLFKTVLSFPLRQEEEGTAAPEAEGGTAG